MACNLTVLSNDTTFHSTCIVVTTENFRFVFDVPEGTQRLLVEHKIRVGKIKTLFLTSCAPASVGGLTGMLLTMSGFNKVDVVGPVSTKTFLDATQNFTGPIGNFVQPKMTKNASLQALEDYLTKDLVISTVPIAADGDNIMNANNFCFIGETPQLPGKFLIEKAVELGVPKGPSFGKLKNGQSITLSDGTVIQSEQVLGEPVPAQNFAIICRLEVPDEQQLQSLYHTAQLDIFRSIQNNGRSLSVMVHMSSVDTINLPSYQSWMSSFGPSTHHIFAGHGCTMSHGNAFACERIYHHKLSYFFPQLFPALQAPYQRSTQQLPMTCKLTVAAAPMMKFHLIPPKRAGLDLTDCQALLEKVRKAEQTATEFILENIDKALIERAKTYANLPLPSTTDPNNVRVYFLGTGCAIPSKYRNVSGMLLYHPMTHAGLMLDCGEGSWFQLLRLMPPNVSALSEQVTTDRETAWANIIQAVWISHLHADHHLGLITVIIRRRELLPSCAPLLVIAPIAVLQFLEQIIPEIAALHEAFVGIPSNYFDPLDLCSTCNNFESASHVADSNEIDIDGGQVVDNSMAVKTALIFGAKRRRQEELRILGPQFGDAASTVQLANEHLSRMGILELINVPVIHCPQACGIILTLRTDTERHIKFVYSGDTRPCDTLVTWGEGADLLIHEATFEDDKAEEAVMKRHTTIAEAMDVARRMRAGSLIMTHFSQRYDGVPLQFQPNNASHIKSSLIDVKPIIAFDFMSIGCSDLQWAKELTPLLAEIFPATETDPEPGEVEES